MHENTIEIIEPTPVPKHRRCKILAALIAVGLTFGPYLTAVAVWYFYNLFFAAGAGLITYLVLGIVRSKLRNGAIPPAQQEYHYNDRAIAAWYVVRSLLCDMH